MTRLQSASTAQGPLPGPFASCKAEISRCKPQGARDNEKAVKRELCEVHCPLARGANVQHQRNTLTRNLNTTELLGYVRGTQDDQRNTE